MMKRWDPPETSNASRTSTSRRCLVARNRIRSHSPVSVAPSVRTPDERTTTRVTMASSHDRDDLVGGSYVGWACARADWTTDAKSPISPDQVESFDRRGRVAE